LITILAICFYGCFTVGIGNKPNWNSEKVYNRQGNIETEISISKPNTIIPFPFLFFLFERKEYQLNIYLLTKQNKLKLEIDSVYYSIFDSTNNLISVVPFVEFGENYNLHIDTAYSSYNLWATTAPIIKVPKKMYEGNLTIEYEVYFREQSIPLKGSKTLYISRPKWMWIESFF
jgi:hypothetical protein